MSNEGPPQLPRILKIKDSQKYYITIGNTKPKNIIRCMKWNAEFAYCVGIIAADGNLSPDGRHISITSKDFEVIDNCRKCLRPSAKTAMKSRDAHEAKIYYLLQFSDVKLYRYLETIGLHPCKSKTINSVTIPLLYFRDFLRGLFDGDGSISIFTNKVSTKSQVKMRFASASETFLNWLKNKINTHVKISGGFVTKDSRCLSLNYGKADSIKIINFMYYDGVGFYLNRKDKTCIRASGEIGKLVSLRN